MYWQHLSQLHPLLHPSLLIDHVSSCASATGALALTYWIGLTDEADQPFDWRWEWADGTSPNNFINNSPEDPYGHWGSAFYSSYLNTECMYAWSSKAYSR